TCADTAGASEDRPMANKAKTAVRSADFAILVAMRCIFSSRKCGPNGSHMASATVLVGAYALERDLLWIASQSTHQVFRRNFDSCRDLFRVFHGPPARSGVGHL